MKKGFDTDQYLKIQSAEILKRVGNSQKLYLEFGGKIYDDFHAARVLPGYDPNAKIKMLQMIKKDSEIIFCISAKDIESSKMRADFGLTYEAVTLKSINDLRSFGLDISAVVINRIFGEEGMRIMESLYDLPRTNNKNSYHYRCDRLANQDEAGDLIVELWKYGYLKQGLHSSGP
jgi:uncharacterized protein (UPF0371 family)